MAVVVTLTLKTDVQTYQTSPPDMTPVEIDRRSRREPSVSLSRISVGSKARARLPTLRKAAGGGGADRISSGDLHRWDRPALRARPSCGHHGRVRIGYSYEGGERFVPVMHHGTQPFDGDVANAGVRVPSQAVEERTSQSALVRAALALLAVLAA